MNPETPPVQPGEILAGKYRVDRVLGTGGMGVVVAATHIELLETRAIKFMLAAASFGGRPKLLPDVMERLMKGQDLAPLLAQAG